ncbi:MAG: hypothetical protein IKU19_09305, partial [Clostridia bacterium]|nr:hypothetical protein [Clostridia bacterium]
MKRIVFLLVILLSLVSCSNQKHIPDFQSFPITLSGTLTCNDSSCAITAVMQDKDTCHITIDSPELLRGYSFKVDNTGISVYYDDMQIELKT